MDEPMAYAARRCKGRTWRDVSAMFAHALRRTPRRPWHRCGLASFLPYWGLDRISSRRLCRHWAERMAQRAMKEKVGC